MRNKLTQLGEYRKKGINGIILDLGIGYHDIQAKIIVNNDNLQHHLKQKEGENIVDDSKFLKLIVEYSPYRLFNSKFASILVKQRIANNSKDKVDGPHTHTHTHLHPNIILDKLNFPNPIDKELSYQIQVDPVGGASSVTEITKNGLALRRMIFNGCYNSMDKRFNLRRKLH